MLSVSLDESCQVHTLCRARVPETPPRPALFQFDLQRIVIYCDARHAELETCCDIPSGPVSSPCAEAGRKWVLGLQKGGVQAWAAAVGVQGTPTLTSPESLLGTRFLVRLGEQAVRSVWGCEEAPDGA